jgi:hydroxymethylglutaryl-CoA lyase
VIAEHEELEIGVHLHARPEDAADMIQSAYAGGARRFDAAMGGLGGCPFAQDSLVGNIPTETLIGVLKVLQATLMPLEPLHEVEDANAQIAREFGGAH